MYQHLCETEHLYHLFGSSSKRIMPLCHLVDDIQVLTLNQNLLNIIAKCTHVISQVMTYDGKKTVTNSGIINMLGQKEGMKVSAIQIRRDDTVIDIENMFDTIKNSSLGFIEGNVYLLEFIKNVILDIAGWLTDIRKVRDKKQFRCLIMLSVTFHSLHFLLQHCTIYSEE